MARGKIVAATNTKGAAELITNGENGILIPISNGKTNDKALTLLFETVSVLSGKFKNKLRINARKKAKEFKVSNNIKKWENLFNQ